MNSISTGELPKLTELSKIAADSNPNREAFADGASGRQVTWVEFDKESNRAADALTDYVGQGDRVVVVCDSSVDHVVLWNGALKAGCTVSNLHVKSSPKLMRDCVDRLAPSVIVLDEAYLAFFQEHVYDEITTDLDAVITTGKPRTGYEEPMPAVIDGASAEAPNVHISEESIATILWTSGSSGKPKGWCLTHRGAITRGVKLLSALNISRTTRRIQTLSPSFAAWFTGTMPALLTGSSTCFVQDWDPKNYL